MIISRDFLTRHFLCNLDNLVVRDPVADVPPSTRFPFVLEETGLCRGISNIVDLREHDRLVASPGDIGRTSGDVNDERQWT